MTVNTQTTFYFELWSLAKKHDRNPCSRTKESQTKHSVTCRDTELEGLVAITCPGLRGLSDKCGTVAALCLHSCTTLHAT